jgi:rubrerythrin
MAVVEQPAGTVPAELLTCAPAIESKRLACDVCGTPMEPEHAHYRCPACHYILPCCGW